jgi:hypothetical protein
MMYTILHLVFRQLGLTCDLLVLCEEQTKSGPRFEDQYTVTNLKAYQFHTTWGFSSVFYTYLIELSLFNNLSNTELE